MRVPSSYCSILLSSFLIGFAGTSAHAQSDYTLELLHAADQEAAAAAIQDAPRFSAVLNALRAQDLGDDGQPDNTIMFFHANNQLLFDAPVNYMYGFRLFFQDPALKHHELVVNEWVPNEEVVAHKVVY